MAGSVWAGLVGRAADVQTVPVWESGGAQGGCLGKGFMACLVGGSCVFAAGELAACRRSR